MVETLLLRFQLLKKVDAFGPETGYFGRLGTIVLDGY